MSNNKLVIIGIDFGTTNTVVSCYDSKREVVKTCRIGRGRDFIPTTVHVDSKGSFRFGDDADDMMELDPVGYARGFKLGLGESGACIFQQERAYTAKDLTRHFLAHLKDQCERNVFLGRQSIDRATITVPAIFTPFRQAELREAAKMAGFREVDVCVEPEAAALAFCEMVDCLPIGSSALVVDWGGGTLDLSYVKRTEKGTHIEKNCSRGDEHMGGEIIDDRLLAYIVKKLKDKGTDLSQESVGRQMKFKRDISKAKESLSFHHQYELSLVTKSGVVQYLLKRSELESLLKDVFDSFISMVNALLNDLKAKKLSNPDMVLLVGGTSKIPKIQELLAVETGLSCSEWEHGMEAVALGASYHQLGTSVKVVYAEGTRGVNEEAKAVERYQFLASQGNAKARYNLGVCYQQGRGVVKNEAKAVEEYKLSASQGNANAQFILGVCYEDGIGVAMDAGKAVELFELAAKQGDAEAQSLLGVCYANGIGVAMDEVKAVEWYKLSAKQGDAEAQSLLGMCYANGIGVAMDEVKAVEWYKLSAKQGYADAQNYLGVCYATGTGVAKDVAKAVEWYKRSAKQGYAAAQCNLGVCYANGTGVAMDEVKAVEWYQLSAKQGYADAQNYLGVCYANGTGVAMDEGKAVELFELAAKQGYAAAQTNLDTYIYYLKGGGIIKEDEGVCSFILFIIVVIIVVSIFVRYLLG